MTFNFALASINLARRELMRTYKRSRIGIGVILIPAMAGGILSIGLSSGQSGDLDLQDLGKALFWLFLVDVGSSPLRLYKRIRPLIVLLEPGFFSLALAAALRSLFFGSLRMIPVVLVFAAKQRSITSLADAGLQILSSPLSTAAAATAIFTCITFIYSLGLFATAFYISFMELNKFLPPMLGFIGYASGYFPVGRPLMISSLDSINPLAVIRQTVTESTPLHSQDFIPLVYSTLILAVLSLLLSSTGTHLVNRLIRVR